MSTFGNYFKLLIRNQGSKLKRKKLIKINRSKMHNLAILEDEKISEIEAYSEPTSFAWLHKVAPGFPVDGSKVTVIYEPSKFYSKFIEKTKSAKKRISIASLYIGTGMLETRLIQALKKTIETNGENLKVNILLDYMRGTRGENNSVKMLMPLLENKHENCCNIFLYHTPKLQGILKTLIPDRFNELVGLQHMKLYIFDDTLIMTGANLSNDYFTNRQDRYIMIENSKDLCDFYCDLIQQISELSFFVEKDGKLVFSKDMKNHPYKSSSQKFSEEASEKIRNFFEAEMTKSWKRKRNDVSNADTWIFPLVQMSQLNIRHDSEITLKLLKSASADSVLRLGTGYFNLTSDYKKAIVNSCKANCYFLTAHPKANGFFGAKGVAGGIPAAYTKLEESFFNLCAKTKQNDRIQLWEFIKPGWTYHAKGLWYSMSESDKPCLTLIGSPNFGYRSVERDLETQIALTTSNQRLQESLQIEHEKLFDQATLVTNTTFVNQERIPPAWVRIAVYFFRYYF